MVDPNCKSCVFWSNPERKMKTDVCPQCGSSLVTTYGETSCIGPDHHQLGEKREWTLERATAFVMPFGKHKGKKMADLPGGYLQWIVENFEDGGIRSAAMAILEKPRNELEPLAGQTALAFPEDAPECPF